MRIRILACAVLMVLSGCSFLTPGLDTRVATEATSETNYTAEGSLVIKKSTTHNQRTVNAEGDDVEVEFSENGAPKKIRGATSVLTECSEPEDAAAAYMHLATKNAEAWGETVKAFRELIPVLGARLGGAAGMDAADSAPAPVPVIPPKEGGVTSRGSSGPAWWVDHLPLIAAAVIVILIGFTSWRARPARTEVNE